MRRAVMSVLVLLVFTGVLGAQEETELLPPLKIGQKGYIQATSEGRRVKVRQIIDDETMIATVSFYVVPGNGLDRDSNVDVILKGVKNTTAVDGELFDVPQFLVVGRAKTKSGRTMFTLEPEKKKK